MKIRKFKNAKIQKFKNSKLQKFENSKIPLKGSRMLIKLKTTPFRLAVSKMDRFKYAIKDNDTDKALELKQEFGLDLKLALFDAIKEDEEAAIAMIENGQRLNLSLSQTNEHNQTPLILACCLKKPKIVKAILCQAKAQDIAVNAKYGSGWTAFIHACYNGLTAIVAMMLEMAQQVKIDLNAKTNSKSTGFIWACRNKHSEVINLIMAKAKSLQIDLHCKDLFGKSGFDYYPEHFQK